MRRPKPFFAGAFTIAPRECPTDVVFIRAYATDTHALAICMFADGTVEPRWVATKPPPPGSGLGRGHWAMVAILGVLYVHGPGDESRYSLVQPAAVDHGSFERALAYVRENAAAWAESIDK